MAIVIKDSLHYPSVDQSIFHFSHLVSEAFDSEVVLVRFLLVQGYKGEEECTCFAMVLVMGKEV
jgi:hypothetical protein